MPSSLDCPLLPFLAGLLYSAGATRIARRHGIHAPFSIALIAELALIAMFLVLGIRYPGSAAHSTDMTGHNAFFGHALASRQFADAFIHGLPLLSFLAGLLYSAGATRSARRHGIHAPFSIALITELVLIAMFLVLGIRYPGSAAHSMEYLLLSLPCDAMGIQTVTVTNINGLRVYTTYLTGSLFKFAESLIEFVFWCIDRLRRYRPQRFQRSSESHCARKRFNMLPSRLGSGSGPSS